MSIEYRLQYPNEPQFVINKASINNLIKFYWADYIDDYKKKGLYKCENTYFGDTLFYRYHPNINIIKIIKNNILEDLITLDCITDFDHGLLKKAILIASLDNNFEIIDMTEINDVIYFTSKKI